MTDSRTLIPSYRRQHTLAEEVVLEGTGLHTGKPARIRLKPAPPSSGVVFRIHHPEYGEVQIPARLEYAISLGHRTTLRAQEYPDVQIETIEHLMGGLFLAGVDNCLVEVEEGMEIPILDGTVGPFLQKIQEAGLQEQDGFRNFLIVRDPVCWSDPRFPDVRYFFLPPPENEGNANGALTCQVTVQIPGWAPCTATASFFYENSQPHLQTSVPEQMEILRRARTFSPLEEVLTLADQGLIQGGSLRLALLIRDPSSEENDRLRESLLKRFPDVPPEEIRFHPMYIYTGHAPHPAEPAYHKMMDLLGDLYLTGRRISGILIAWTPGHRTNLAFARKLQEHFEAEQRIPRYDPVAEPLMLPPDIEKVLPHRHPFLLVDKIIYLDDTTVVGVKAITYTEPFFQGHFPRNPVLPGVLIIEAMAQTGGVLALKTVPDPQNWDTYFLKIDRVKFKRIVRPGDVLVMKLRLLSPIRRGLVHMEGVAYVGDQQVAEAELLARLVRKSG